MGSSNQTRIEEPLVEMTPRQRAAANARAHRKPGYTPEGLERLRAAALKNQPWTHSTGPTSPEGKARSARNAYTGGHRTRLEASQAWRQGLSKFVSSIDVDDARAEIAAALAQVRLRRATGDATDQLGNEVGEVADAVPQGGVEIDNL